jgi:hypothetical protein
MKLLARWAWVVVLGTALALSWWSLDALARHYGMPPAFAAMVSATFDGAALVAADLALRRAAVADSAAAVKLLMLSAVGLSGWLNFEHAVLLGYPIAVRVLFACPSVIGGSLFELQLRSLHRARLHELGRVAAPLPRFGLMVWAFHPFAATRRVSQITNSRLHSVPLEVMDWTGAPGLMVTSETSALAQRAPVELPSGAGVGAPDVPPSATHLQVRDAGVPHRVGRRPVPDEYYAAKLRELVAAGGGITPSAREVARLLSIGQDRARRLVAQLDAAAHSAA